MAFPNEHLRLSFFGDGWSEQEEWSTGLRLDGEVMPTDAQMVSLSDAFSTLFQDNALQTSGNVRYLGLKAAPQDVDGRYPADGLSKTYLLPAPVVEGFVGGLPQATIAATLTTATPRGLANEGRMYLPATTWVPTPDGRITAPQATAIAAAVARFVDAVNDVGVGPVTVFSKGTPKTPVGAKRAVTGTRIGRVIDTQRRRRSQIAELYVTASLGN